MKPRTLIRIILPLLLAGLCSRAGADATQQAKAPAYGGPDNRVVIYLGSIAVDGERKVYEALQDIKVALDQPLSNDPKLADTMVCRVADEIGTHVRQVLICGTNRVLAQNRVIVQTGVDGVASAGQACGEEPCSDQAYGILYETVTSQPQLYILQQVNGSNLKALLAAIPYPGNAPAATPFRDHLPALSPPHTGTPEKAPLLAEDLPPGPSLGLVLTAGLIGTE